MRYSLLAAVLTLTLLPSLAYAADIDSDSDPSAPSGRSGQATDADGDGLADKLEQAFGSNPAIADTDGDGYTDGVEVNAGYSPTSIESTKLPKSIQITLSTQELAYYLNDVELGRFSISSGKKGTPTPVGEFKIYSKHPRAWSNRAKLWMPNWMAFYPTGLYGIHELPEWPGGKKEGADHLGTPASGGCVRLGVGPAKLLYDWAPVGTRVVVRK
jgi:lipoprotein-anchoring transpeptidase ErfK/SrfK